jgi:mannose-6-phosphate isomerase-like protein (cupin superfamily)
LPARRHAVVQGRNQLSKGNHMRHKTTVFTFSVAMAFAAGIVVSPLTLRAMPAAHAAAAQPASLAPAVIDLTALRHGDLPATALPELNSKGLVTTDNATVAVQSGNVAKHIHRHTDEIQYIIEGTGTMWVGGERKQFKPGTLLIIPKGTPHGGSIVATGPVKALAIKIPPQAKDDTVFVN